MKFTTVTKLLLLAVIGSTLFFTAVVKATNSLKAGTDSLMGEGDKGSKDFLEESKTGQPGSLKKPVSG